MKLNTNTLIPKIIKMKTEILIIEKTIDEVNSLMMLKDEMKFASSIEKMIKNFPELEYFNEEISTIKECLIDVFDGYENREEVVLYMNFMKRVILNTKEYIK